MKIKDWLVPHKQNHYHPRMLRPIGLSIVIAALLFVNLAYNYTAAKQIQVLGYATSISASEVISLSNSERTSRGVAALTYNAKLTQAAQAKAQDMFANDYWAHNSPSGKTPWSFISGAGYAYTTAGENLAKNFNTSAGVVSGWMNSSGHKANILNSSFTETGVAAVNGVLDGLETTLVVAMYAAPQAAAPPPAPKPAPTPIVTQTAPKPAPTPKPAPKEEPKPEASTEEPEEEQPVVTQTTPTQGDSTTQTINQEPVSSKEPRTWAQNASFFILSTLLLITILKHTVVWRTQRRGWRHVWLRAHPAAQYGLIIVALLANAASGVGVIL